MCRSKGLLPGFSLPQTPLPLAALECARVQQKRVKAGSVSPSVYELWQVSELHISAYRALWEK